MPGEGRKTPRRGQHTACARKGPIRQHQVYIGRKGAVSFCPRHPTTVCFQPFDKRKVKVAAEFFRFVEDQRAINRVGHVALGKLQAYKSPYFVRS